MPLRQLHTWIGVNGDISSVQVDLKQRLNDALLILLWHSKRGVTLQCDNVTKSEILSLP
jgi:hypothetical protein